MSKYFSSRAARVAAGIGVAMALIPAAAAQADADLAGVTVAAGQATLTAPMFSDFPQVTLNGSAQTKTADVADWAVNDARGKGDGWSVNISATLPTDETTTPGTPVSMTGAALGLTAPTAGKVDESNTSGAPAVLGGSLLDGGVKVVDAQATEGMGAWTFAQDADDLELTVPANAKTGTYTTLITTTLTASEV